MACEQNGPQNCVNPQYATEAGLPNTGGLRGIQSGAFLFEDLKRFRFCNDELAYDLLEAKVAEFIMVLCGVFIAMNHVEAVKNSVPELIIAFQEELSKIWNNITEHQSFAINDNNVHSRPSTFKTGTAG